MANGIVIDGVTQSQGFGLGLGGFGRQLGHASTKAGSPSTFYQGSVGRGGGAAALLCLQANQQLSVPEFAPRVGDSWLQTCGSPGGPPCDVGAAQSSISGFGGLRGSSQLGVIGCSSLDLVLNELSNLQSSPSFAQLSAAGQNAVNNALSTLGGFGVYINVLGNQCDTDTASAQAVLTSARAELGANAPPLLNPLSVVPPSSNPASPGGQPSSGLDVRSIVMWSAIGLVAVAGAYALGPIFRGVGSLIHPKGK